MKTLIKEREELYQLAADRVEELLAGKPDAVVTMAAGRTMLPLWRILTDRYQKGSVSFRHVRFFQTAELEGAEEQFSFRAQVERNLMEKTDLRPENCVWLSDHSPEEVDSLLEEAGGLDLAILGLGVNAHIGLNEPATPFFSRTRRQKLTEKTRSQLQWMFGEECAVPEIALTLGIRTLTDARQILVLAVGAEKAQAVFDMLYARDDSVIPAAFLQIPADVTVYVDPEAGNKL
ncbi:MAG: 6-phosphogluconolactonase [Oscillospiraceae bacterium]|nr:6-phosphogluconolactonase [Oscillospiraceae bacterium]